MSPREEVTTDRLRSLLEALGREFRHPARLYLTGGEGLVWRGLRGSTMDVDIAYEVDPRHHDEWYRCLRALKESARVSIEEAGPADFIPLPPGHESRASHIGRFGAVDVYLFDPYAVALAKAERGHARDDLAVRAMLDAGLVTAGELRRLLEVILPAYERGSLRADPARFRANLERILLP